MFDLVSVAVHYAAMGERGERVEGKRECPSKESEDGKHKWRKAGNLITCEFCKNEREDDLFEWAPHGIEPIF